MFQLGPIELLIVGGICLSVILLPIAAIVAVLAINRRPGADRDAARQQACPNCAQMVSINFSYCPHCGGRLQAT
jgi:hypothetical protein